MLIRLTIKNYILIRDLEISFGEGFSVITGETGSGKSILLGALGLILGQRADSGSLLNTAEKCIVEGIFNIQGYGFEELLNQNDLDFDPQLIIRREINPAGKSRAFINDTPVSLSVLKCFGEKLVNIHSQHAVLSLNDTEFQLAVLDNYAGIQEEVEEFRRNFLVYTDMARRLEEMSKMAENAATEQDYQLFLYEELKSAGLKPGELLELEEKLTVLNHAEEIKSGMINSVNMLENAEINILGLIGEVSRQLHLISKYNPTIRPIVDRLQTNYIDIKDLTKEISTLEEDIEVNKDEAIKIAQRLDFLNRLLKKHHKNSTEELLIVLEQISEKLSGSDHLRETIIELEKEISETGTALRRKAEDISLKRKKHIPSFSGELVKLLSKVGIPEARFDVQITGSGKLHDHGSDTVKYVFSANKGAIPKDISQTASGGELSRLMLAIKSMISQKNLLPTIIFDEIDNGVSGEIAGKVGAILRNMGKKMQVIAITHLPQIAGMGDIHYLVQKSNTTLVAETAIYRLNREERTEEIAKMLSNEKITEAARNTANELLSA